MQETAPTPPASPGRINIQLPGINLEVPNQNQPMRPLTAREIDAIRDRRSDMSSQLNSAVDRRNDLAGDLRDATPGTEQGILARIQLLDQRILQIERDIESSGQMLRSGMTVDNGVPLVAAEDISSMRQETLSIIGVSVSVFFLLPLALGAMRLMFRRARHRESQPSAEQAARLERIEQAVDAVAIEIERVGEAQRYQGRVLAEANLMPALEAGQAAAQPLPLREYEGTRRFRDAAP